MRSPSCVGLFLLSHCRLHKPTITLNFKRIAIFDVLPNAWLALRINPFRSTNTFPLYRPPGLPPRILDFPHGSPLACPQCTRPDCPVHDTETRQWRHLNYFFRRGAAEQHGKLFAIRGWNGSRFRLDGLGLFCAKSGGLGLRNDRLFCAKCGWNSPRQKGILTGVHRKATIISTTTDR